MRKFLKLAVFFLLLAAIATGAFFLYRHFTEPVKDPPAEEPPFSRKELDKASPFGDYVFEQLVRELINVPEGDMDLDSLKSITELDLTNSGALIDKDYTVNSLEGLKYFPSLKKLVADKNYITSLEGIESCTELEYLSVSSCLITDFSPVSELTKLKYLDISKNIIYSASGNTDLSYLEKLSELEYLNIAQNEYVSFSGLADCELSELKTLIAASNDCEDLTEIFKLTQLEILDISNLGLHSVEGIGALDSLRVLNCGSNEQITDLSPLADCKSLTELDASVNNLEDLKTLVNCKKLEILNVRGNIIEDISHLTSMPSVKKIDVSGNSISDFLPLFTSSVESYRTEEKDFRQWTNNNRKYAEAPFENW